MAVQRRPTQGKKLNRSDFFHGLFEPSRDACGDGGHGRKGEDEKGAGGGGADGEAGY